MINNFGEIVSSLLTADAHLPAKRGGRTLGRPTTTTFNIDPKNLLLKSLINY